MMCGFYWHSNYMGCTIVRLNKQRGKECGPVGFQSPPCVSVAPPAAFLHTLSEVLLRVPAAPDCGPPVKTPPAQFTAQQKL